MPPMKLTERARILNKHIGEDDEFFEDMQEVAMHYRIIRLMMDDNWVMKPEYCIYINPMHLHIVKQNYTMKTINNMKCKGCTSCM